MIVLDNIVFSLQKAGGISSVWINLIVKLNKLSQDIILLESDNVINIFRKKVKIPKSRIRHIRFFHPIITQFIRPKYISKDKFIFHSSYFRTCKSPNAINVTTLHDFIYEQGKPNFKQKVRIHLDYRAIRKSDAIVCVSENTRKDLFKFLPDIDPNKVYVIYNGVSDEYKPIRKDLKNNQFKNYVLFVGGRQGYKNFNFVVNSIKDSDYRLLICGSTLNKEEYELLERVLPNRYKIIIFPTNQELNIIYNSVYALAYPSSYEGFGIPVLEAQRACCPVIALNSSSIPEIIGDTPLLMNELSKELFIEKLKILRNDEIRSQVIEQGLINSARFSWDKMANEYYNLYNKLLKN